MKKGKTLTVLVLVLEITTIAVLHVVKIEKSEKTVKKEVSRANKPAGTCRYPIRIDLFAGGFQVKNKKSIVIEK